MALRISLKWIKSCRFIHTSQPELYNNDRGLKPPYSGSAYALNKRQKQVAVKVCAEQGAESTIQVTNRHNPKDETRIVP
jgi:hypothetical protein